MRSSPEVVEEPFVEEPAVDLTLLAAVFKSTPRNKGKAVDLGELEYSFIGLPEGLPALERVLVLDGGWTRVSQELVDTRLEPEERHAYNRYLTARRELGSAFALDHGTLRNVTCIESRTDELRASEQAARAGLSRGPSPLAWVLAAQLLEAHAFGLEDERLRKLTMQSALDLAQRASDATKDGDPVFHHAQMTLAILLEQDDRQWEAFATVKSLLLAAGSPFMPGEVEARAAQSAPTPADATFLLGVTVERARAGSQLWTYAKYQLLLGALRGGDDTTALQLAADLAVVVPGSVGRDLSENIFASLLPASPDWFEREVPAVPRSAFVAIAKALVDATEARGDLDLGARLRDVVRSVSPEAASEMKPPPATDKGLTESMLCRERVHQLVHRCDPGGLVQGRISIVFDGRRATVEPAPKGPQPPSSMMSCMTRWSAVMLRGLPRLRARVRFLE